MNRLAAQLDAETVAELTQRYPEAFGRSLKQQIFLGLAWLGFALALLVALDHLGISFDRIIKGLDRIWYIAGGLFPPSSGGAFFELLAALLESIGMAFLGTLIASCIAMVLGLLGAGNIVSSWLLRFSFRRSFDFLRGVDALVWALVYVRAVGLGPLAGVLAIATSDIGTLSKLYAETIENAEKQQADGVAASGGNRLQIIRFGILPQVLPIMLSNALYMFESNTRSATILGIVGAGGIGFHLSDRIRAHRWDEVGFIIIMIIVAVFVLDLISRYLRGRLINSGTKNVKAGILAKYADRKPV